MRKIQSSIVRLGLSILTALYFMIPLGITTPALQAAPAAETPKKAAKVDVNNADAKTLEELPGIGPALAQRIIENRPYKKLADLEKVPGLSKAKADALKGQITFGKTAATTTGKGTGRTTKEKPTGKETLSTAPAGKVNVNTADAKTLQELPGIGPALAQRIIENRPYKSLADLLKVKGFSKSEIDKIKNQVTFGAPETAAKRPAESPSKATRGTEGPGAPTGRTPEQLAPGEKINLNTATAEQLDKLYGIGPVKAQAIIEYRQQHGNFKSIDEIKNVKGIKESEFDKIKDHITVGR